jgi:hypothetical protein
MKCTQYLVPVIPERTVRSNNERNNMIIQGLRYSTLLKCLYIEYNCNNGRLMNYLAVRTDKFLASQLDTILNPFHPFFHPHKIFLKHLTMINP